VKGELMGRLKVLAIASVAALIALAAIGCGGGGGDESTLVFGTASDPTALDGALISDGESIRVLYQMTEGLTALSPGTSDVIPSLATDWTTSDDGLAWTFNLREGVTFHDGEPFNAEAVCFNFDRWYNFPPALQGEGTTYYWQFGFGGGFADPGEDSPGPDESLYESCEATDELSVTLNLTKPSSTILSTLTLPSLHIVSPTALQEFEADAGAQNDDGIFQPGGTYSTEHPTGTGPYKFESWTVGEQLVLARNDDYWGEGAQTEKIIFRPIADNAARLQAIQTGEVQGYDLVEPQDVETSRSRRWTTSSCGRRSPTRSTRKKSSTRSTPAAASSRRSSCHRRSSATPRTCRRTSSTRTAPGSCSSRPASRCPSRWSSGTRPTSPATTCRIRSATSRRLRPS
jgi:peptide/nickel transport system substrate-binding protein